MIESRSATSRRMAWSLARQSAAPRRTVAPPHCRSKRSRELNWRRFPLGVMASHFVTIPAEFRLRSCELEASSDPAFDAGEGRGDC